jgi:hypothetical protein
MAGIYTNIARKRVEQNKEASHPSKPTADQASLSSPFGPSPQKERISGNHEILKTRKHEDVPPSTVLADKPQKYSTLLDSNLIKRVKLYATESDIKDYEVLELALTEFCERHKQS